MHIIVNNTLINYNLSGKPVGVSGSVIVFLHGWGRTMEDFDDLAARLAAYFPQFSFLQMDLPGFGGSPLARQDGLSLDDYCTTLSALFEKLGCGRVILIGHSLGGRIAVKFAMLYPDQVEKLVLISAAGIRRRSPRLILLRVARSLFNTMFFAVRDFVFILRLKNLFGAAFGSRDYQVSHGALRETLKRVLAEDLRPDAKKISAPTLLLWGKNDRIAPPRDAAEYHALIKDSRLEILNGGHFIFLQKPEKCTDSIASFLKN